MPVRGRRVLVIGGALGTLGLGTPLQPRRWHVDPLGDTGGVLGRRGERTPGPGTSSRFRTRRPCGLDVQTPGP
jgi:hypothetical protein